jgi:hypothetical protein
VPEPPGGVKGRFALVGAGFRCEWKEERIIRGFGQKALLNPAGFPQRPRENARRRFF